MRLLRCVGFCFGLTSILLGQIQHSTTSTPAQVCGLEGVVAVAGGLALRTDGTVWECYGLSPPAPVSGLGGIVAIAASGENIALAGDGAVWEWEGPNEHRTRPATSPGWWRSLPAIPAVWP